MEQLCWKCCNATNGKRCTWVKCFMYPDGVKLDGDNNIVFCPLFRDDIADRHIRKTEIVNYFGIPERTYYRHKTKFAYLYSKYKHVENVPKLGVLCDYFGKSTQKIIENYEFFLQKYLTIFGKSV